MKGVIIVILLLSNTFLITSMLDKEICEEVYYLVASTNWEYSISDLNTIANKTNLTENEIIYYINGYNNLCYVKGYSDLLPKKTSGILILNKTKEECILEEGVFESIIPFPETNIGIISCRSLKTLNFIFHIEKVEDNYVINGIEIQSLVIVGLIIVFSSVIISNRLINKYSRGIKK